MIPVDNVRVRANLCLDCHFGSARAGQFVDHHIMAAGHPRLVFELDLFTTLQRHHDEDSDYRARKQPPGIVRSWAVGQALALDRALTLLGGPRGGGAFPEFVFFDCRSCHRTFTDDPAARFAGQANPLRPLPPGAPVFNDENIILLGVAARAVDPALAARLEAQARAFHLALTGDRAGALKAGATLAAHGAGAGRAVRGCQFQPGPDRADAPRRAVGPREHRLHRLSGRHAGGDGGRDADRRAGRRRPAECGGSEGGAGPTSTAPMQRSATPTAGGRWTSRSRWRASAARWERDDEAAACSGGGRGAGAAAGLVRWRWRRQFIDPDDTARGAAGHPDRRLSNPGAGSPDDRGSRAHRVPGRCPRRRRAGGRASSPSSTASVTCSRCSA